jgi:hypothetical protein
MTTYQLLLDHVSNTPNAVLRSDGWSIPFDPDNTDFLEYQKWLAAGNTPIPADEPNA